MATNQAELDTVTADIEHAHTHITAARRYLDDQQPQTAHAKRKLLHAEIAIANRTRAFGTAAVRNQPATSSTSSAHPHPATTDVADG